ncbi:hypothetical protein Y032_0721g1826 [Ancylostoma ceylanicum]|uniref:Uncharacterized protein n=1 Tax=Ancylostoma ceylanicum TaxID=53326 RepID=A0A016WGG3_9BILA|nr:hypothetical protein Y032_0721g1826 [Ancylostoma ceylanicum]
MDSICHFLMVWYYCTLTIRESILILNGSKLGSWWVAHHYLACVIGGVALTWPDDASYQVGETVIGTAESTCVIEITRGKRANITQTHT